MHKDSPSEIQVSAIIPMYNAKKWVRSAVESVLRQKRVECECIVVDDGSTDGSAEWLEKKYGDRITVIRQVNSGNSAARNRGAAAARGKYIAFLDADDAWCGWKLYFQMQYLEKHADTQAVYCQSLQVNEKMRPLMRKPLGRKVKDSDLHLKALLARLKTLGLGSTLMIRKEVHGVVGGFDESILFGSDRDYQLQLSYQGMRQHVIPLPLALIRHRQHSLSHAFDTKNWTQSAYSRLSMYEKLRKQVQDGDIQSLVDKHLNRLRIRILYFYIYIKDTEEAERMFQTLQDQNAGRMIEAQLFYRQILHFLPHIYRSGEMREMMRFIEDAMKARDRLLPEYTNPQEDELIRFRGRVLAAKRGGYEDVLAAWKSLYQAVRADPRILFKRYIWKHILRLCKNSLPIWKRERE